MSQQPTVPWSLELYVLDVPPMWAAWALLLWRADYCGWSSRLGCPQSGCLPGSALLGGCQCCLMGEDNEAAGWTTLGDIETSVGSLVGGDGVQEIPGLVPNHRCVKPSPGAILAHLLAEPGPGFCLQGPGEPELVSDHCSGHSWLQRLGCPESCVGILMGRVRTQPSP